MWLDPSLLLLDDYLQCGPAEGLLNGFMQLDSCTVEFGAKLLLACVGAGDRCKVCPRRDIPSPS